MISHICLEKIISGIRTTHRKDAYVIWKLLCLCSAWNCALELRYMFLGIELTLHCRLILINSTVCSLSILGVTILLTMRFFLDNRLLHFGYDFLLFLDEHRHHMLFLVLVTHMIGSGLALHSLLF